MACNATLMFCVLVYKRFRAVRGPQPGFAMCYSAYVACVTQREEITDETTAVSKWNFVLIALLDTCMLLLTVIPGGRVPAPLTVILLQAATPAQLGVGALFRSFRCVPHAGVAGASAHAPLHPGRATGGLTGLEAWRSWLPLSSVWFPSCFGPSVASLARLLCVV